MFSTLRTPASSQVPALGFVCVRVAVPVWLLNLVFFGERSCLAGSRGGNRGRSLLHVVTSQQSLTPAHPPFYQSPLCSFCFFYLWLCANTWKLS